MFTAKFYGLNGRRVIHEAESFSIMPGDSSGHEVTLHRAAGNDIRIDMADEDDPRKPGWPETYQRLVIENANGKTTEMITTPKAMGQPF